MYGSHSEKRPQPSDFATVGHVEPIIARTEPIVETISDTELLQYLAVIEQHNAATHAYPTVYEIMVRLRKSDVRQSEQFMHQLVQKNYVRMETVRGTPVYILTEEGRKLVKK